MDHGNVIIRFRGVTYGYDEENPLLEEADFSVRENAKMTIMGQNGAGKSTLFKLLTGDLKPTEGEIHFRQGASIAIGLQVLARELGRMMEFIDPAEAVAASAIRLHGAQGNGSLRIRCSGQTETVMRHVKNVLGFSDVVRILYRRSLTKQLKNDI